MTKPKPIGIWPGKPGGYVPVMADELKPCAGVKGAMANVEKHGNAFACPQPRRSPNAFGTKNGTMGSLSETPEERARAQGRLRRSI
jgi:hypothetical protein